MPAELIAPVAVLASFAKVAAAPTAFMKLSFLGAAGGKGAGSLFCSKAAALGAGKSGTGIVTSKAAAAETTKAAAEEAGKETVEEALFSMLAFVGIGGANRINFSSATDILAESRIKNLKINENCMRAVLLDEEDEDEFDQNCKGENIAGEAINLYPVYDEDCVFELEENNNNVIEYDIYNEKNGKGESSGSNLYGRTVKLSSQIHRRQTYKKFLVADNFL